MVAPPADSQLPPRPNRFASNVHSSTFLQVPCCPAVRQVPLPSCHFRALPRMAEVCASLPEGRQAVLGFNRNTLPQLAAAAARANGRPPEVPPAPSTVRFRERTAPRPMSRRAPRQRVNSVTQPGEPPFAGTEARVGNADLAAFRRRGIPWVDQESSTGTSAPGSCCVAAFVPKAVVYRPGWRNDQFRYSAAGAQPRCIADNLLALPRSGVSPPLPWPTLSLTLSAGPRRSAAARSRGSAPRVAAMRR